MTVIDNMITIITNHYPDVQAAYLFGTWGTENEKPDSDADIAILLEPRQAKTVPPLILSDLRIELEDLLKQTVDLINLRQVPTVLQKEVVAAGRRILLVDKFAADLFEMLTISYYLKLNEERAEIIRDGLESGRFIE